MRVAVIHVAFRLYWPPRLRCLHEFLQQHEVDVQVVELAGKGSSYGFADTDCNQAPDWWHCLFPQHRVEDVPDRRAHAACYEFLAQMDPDVVIGCSLAFTTGAAAMRWAKARGKAAIMMENARPEDAPRSRFVNWVKYRLYRNLDAALSPSPRHPVALPSWGVPRERIFHGLNVADNDYFARESAARRVQAAELRAQWHLPPRFLLGIGRQVPKKNWDTFLRAYGAFREQHAASDLALVLVGDGPERPRLERLVTERKIPDVQFRPFVTQADACGYYALATALVLPSLHGETWGLVVNEAMACGLPVLVSRHCGCASTLVEDGQNGWSFPPLDEAAITQAITNLAALDEPAWQQFSERSRQLVAQWPLQRFAEGLWQAIQKATTEPRSCPSVADRFLLWAWRGHYHPT